MANWLNMLLKGKKVAGDIKFVKPQVKPTGTKSLIDKFKKTVKNVKTTDDVLNICNKLHKDGHIERAKNGITYYWRKID